MYSDDALITAVPKGNMAKLDNQVYITAHAITHPHRRNIENQTARQIFAIRVGNQGGRNLPDHHNSAHIFDL